MAITDALRPVGRSGADTKCSVATVRPRWYVEVAIVAFFYGAYERSRAAAPTHPGLALRHAHAVISVERSLHLGVEIPINRVFAAHDWVGAIGGYYYATLHFIVTLGVLIWLYLRRPELYSRARTMLVLASFAALAVYVLFPVAPPRLAVPGMTDILLSHNVFGASHAGKSGDFVNIYAAMPSLHVGWAAWSAFWINRGHPTSRWRHAAWLYPMATTLVVLGTANHYTLDAIAGLAIMLTAAALSGPKVRWLIQSRVDSLTRAIHRRYSSVEATRCEFCDYEGPRRYLVTFMSMLTANGLHVELPAGGDALDG
jgi:hypothetical protein